MLLGVFKRWVTWIPRVPQWFALSRAPVRCCSDWFQSCMAGIMCRMFAWVCVLRTPFCIWGGSTGHYGYPLFEPPKAVFSKKCKKKVCLSLGIGPKCRRQKQKVSGVVRSEVWSTVVGEMAWWKMSDSGGEDRRVTGSRGGVRSGWTLFIAVLCVFSCVSMTVHAVKDDVPLYPASLSHWSSGSYHTCYGEAQLPEWFSDSVAVAAAGHRQPALRPTGWRLPDAWNSSHGGDAAAHTAIDELLPMGEQPLPELTGSKGRYVKDEEH